MRKCTTHKNCAAAKGIQLELVVFDGFHHACAFYYSGSPKLATIYDKKRKYKNTKLGFLERRKYKGRKQNGSKRKEKKWMRKESRKGRRQRKEERNMGRKVRRGNEGIEGKEKKQRREE